MKTSRLKKLTIMLAAIVILIAAVFGFLWSGILYKTLLKPDKVENLKVDDVCYSRIALTWDEAKHAEGYRIYEEKDGEEVFVGMTDKECSFDVADYEKDVDHVYYVKGYRSGFMSDEMYEGESSDTVDAIYDSSRYAQKIPVLGYHYITRSDTRSTNSLIISDTDFEEQMKWLHDNGYTALTMDDFYKWHAGKKEFPKKSCVITFDDGEYGVYHLAYPIIKKYGLAATSFVIGHHIADTTPAYDVNAEGTPHVGRDVITEVRAEYPKFEFESHTFNMHKKINGKKPVNVFTYEQMVEDIHKNDPYDYHFIAYPWGSYNETFKQALKDCGYKMGFAYGPYYYATRDNDSFEIDRIKVSGTKGIESFIKIVSGEKKSYNRTEEE